MKWRCPVCGHEQPAHPRTTREEMPFCSQPVQHRGLNCITVSGYYVRVGRTPNPAPPFSVYAPTRQFLAAGSCGGWPEKIETTENKI